MAFTIALDITSDVISAVSIAPSYVNAAGVIYSLASYFNLYPTSATSYIPDSGKNYGNGYAFSELPEICNHKVYDNYLIVYYDAQAFSVGIRPVISGDTAKEVVFKNYILPIANFSADIVGGYPPLTINFTDLSINSPTSWEWDFGDGSSHSFLQNPIHVFSTAGTYTVILEATNEDGYDLEVKHGYISIFQDEFVSAISLSANYSMLDPTIIHSNVVFPVSSMLEFYVSPYYEIYAGGIPNFLDTDDMPNEWVRKCDGQDYDNERELYRNLVTESYNKFGVCMTYYITSYDTRYDRIWGEDNDRRFIRKFEFMAFYPLQSEEKMWTKFAIEGIDNFSIFVSKDHYRVACTYGQDKVRGNIGEGTYPIYVPKTGDIVQSMFNNYLYEITNVKEEAMMVHLSKRYVWELVVKPYMDEHLSLDAETSASMGTISAFVDKARDILDIRNEVISAAIINAYVPKSCERNPRDPFNGW